MNLPTNRTRGLAAVPSAYMGAQRENGADHVRGRDARDVATSAVCRKDLVHLHLAPRAPDGRARLRGLPSSTAGRMW
jgi:hypothetical protein